MPIIFRCQNCNQKLSAPNRKAGKTIKCPACSFEFSIPAADNADAERADQDDQQQLPVLPTADDDDDDEGLLLRKANTEFDDMDLTPMVDVTFLLLIFFMITASFTIQKTIQVPPPDPQEDGASVTPQEMEDLERVSIEIAVDEKNTITVDDEPLSDSSSLAEVIQGIMRKEQKRELLLKANARSMHQTTILVIDAANEAHIQKIRIVTSEWIRGTGVSPVRESIIVNTSFTAQAGRLCHHELVFLVTSMFGVFVVIQGCSRGFR